MGRPSACGSGGSTTIKMALTDLVLSEPLVVALVGERTSRHECESGESQGVGRARWVVGGGGKAMAAGEVDQARTQTCFELRPVAAPSPADPQPITLDNRAVSSMERGSDE